MSKGISEITIDATLSPTNPENTSLSPTGGDNIEIQLTYSFLEKRRIHFQWESNFSMNEGVFELVELRADRNALVVYSGNNFEYTLTYSRECLGRESVFKIVLKGDGLTAESNIVLIAIPPEIPSQPPVPKLQLSSKTTAFVRWNAVENNGAPIIAYHLECLLPDSNGYTEVYRGTERNIKLPIKLDSEREYKFRLRAENSVGCSQCGAVLSYLTSPGRSSRNAELYIYSIHS